MLIAAAVADLFTTSEALAVRARYHEPWRHYHDWSHPIAMIRHLTAAELSGVPIEDPVAAVGFILWHDAIYDPQATHGRNERLSAALCRATFAAAPSSVDRAVAAIEATIDHRLPSGPANDIALLLDVDLAILGAADPEFDAYDAQIAAEYGHVPADAYRTGRAAILRRFLERDRLYLTDWAADRWERRARANLTRAIAKLA